MASYSGFITNFTGTSSNTDILSNVVLTTALTSYSVTYNCGYIYIGNLLLQFSNGQIIPGGNSASIYFPIPYSACLGVVATGYGNNTLTISLFNNNGFALQYQNYPFTYFSWGLK
jgi:hypothetical protein